MTRDERQELSVQPVVATNCLGTVEAFTAYGKTRVAVLIIRLLRRYDDSRKVVVVVPTILLKSQWEEGLKEVGLDDNTEVYVINTLIKKPAVTTSLLILDEIHRYAANTFSKVFDIVRYSFVLGLTATMSRLDGKHALLNTYAPICDRISLAEGKRNGWVAPFTEYNLAVRLDDEGAEKYREMGRKYGYFSGKFQSDFELMKNCSYTEKPGMVIRGQWRTFEPKVVQYAKRLGWTGNSAAVAFDNMMYNRTAPRGRKRSLWGNDSHPYSPKRLYVWAVQGMKTMRDMKEFIQGHPSKIREAERLIRTLEGMKTITFCETTKAVDELAEKLGKTAVIYHSNMEPGTKRVMKSKSYKTLSGAEKWIDDNPEWKIRKLKNKTYKVYTYVTKTIAPKEMRERAIARIQNSHRVNVVCTAKALDQGFDFPGAELGIIYARTSSPTQHIQRTGRIIRKHFKEDGSEKRGIVVNIYLEDTKDYRWLVKAQSRSAGVIWVSSIEEIWEHEQERPVLNS